MFRRFCLLGLMLLSLNAIDGPEPTSFGDLVVYHNVFNSSMLQPDIAASAGLMRGPTHGVLNVAVQRPDGSAVDAVLKGEVRSLIGQPVALDFKRIQEGDAIYFVANYSATQRGVLLFKVDIQAEEGAMVHSLSFKQEFFPDDQ